MASQAKGTPPQAYVAERQRPLDAYQRLLHIVMLRKQRNKSRTTCVGQLQPLHPEHSALCDAKGKAGGHNLMKTRLTARSRKLQTSVPKTKA